MKRACMQIPLHVMSLMAYTPTTEFHHPMTAVQSINIAGAVSGLPNDVISGAANYFTYKAFDLHLWQGVAEHVRLFRKHLGLPEYPSDTNAPAHALHNLRIPVSYLWSPSLRPKPRDWGSHVQVRCGVEAIGIVLCMVVTKRRSGRALVTIRN